MCDFEECRFNPDKVRSVVLWWGARETSLNAIEFFDKKKKCILMMGDFDMLCKK